VDASGPALLFLAASYLRECSSALLHDFGHATAVNELAFPTAFHQAGFIQDFQVMRNSSGSDPGKETISPQFICFSREMASKIVRRVLSAKALEIFSKTSA
jgi:hypothetical protein